MSTLYSTIVADNGKTSTRRGFKTISASAQSYEGSLTVRIDVGADGSHFATIQRYNGSGVGGTTLWSGLLAELLVADRKLTVA